MLQFFLAGNTFVINDTKENVVLAENVDFNINASDTVGDVSSAGYGFLKTVVTGSSPHEVALGNELRVCTEFSTDERKLCYNLFCDSKSFTNTKPALYLSSISYPEIGDTNLRCTL